MSCFDIVNNGYILCTVNVFPIPLGAKEAPPGPHPHACTCPPPIPQDHHRHMGTRHYSKIRQSRFIAKQVLLKVGPSSLLNRDLPTSIILAVRVMPRTQYWHGAVSLEKNQTTLQG